MLNEQLDLHACAAGGYRSLPPSILSISALLARALPRFPPPMRLPPSPPSQLPTDTAPAPARSGQLKSNRSRRSFGGPRAPHELRPNCVLADHGAAAGRLVPPAVLPPAWAPSKPPFVPAPIIHTSAEGRPPSPASAPPPAAPGLGPPLPPARARGVQPRPVPGCPGRGSTIPRPPPPSSALGPQTPACRLVPGAAQRGPAAQSALTWKCSAIFPGGGAGPRPREPEGRERRRAARKPQPPAGSLRRSLARPPPERRGPRVRSAGRGGA